MDTDATMEDEARVPRVFYVYTLSTYMEEGAENMTATLSRDRLPALFREWVAGLGWKKGFEFETEKLAELLARSDAELVAMEGGHNLSRGWGGAMLHVCVLK